jgi:hypothetical protein
MHNVAALSQAHKRFVNGYARNPGCESGASLKLIQIAMRLEQRFLLCVLSVLLVARDSKCQAKSALLAVLKGLRTHNNFAFPPKTCGDWAIHNSPLP